VPLGLPSAGDLALLLAQAHAYPAEVRERLEWFVHFDECRSISETCRRFAVARTTFYRWARRFDAKDLSTLEDNPTLGWMTDPEPTATIPETQVATASPADIDDIRLTIPGGAWRAFKRSIVVASILMNLALAGVMLGTAALEAQVSSERNLEEERSAHQRKMITDCENFLRTWDDYVVSDIDQTTFEACRQILEKNRQGPSSSATAR
jgi:hypothetical protein